MGKKKMRDRIVRLERRQRELREVIEAIVTEMISFPAIPKIPELSLWEDKSDTLGVPITRSEALSISRRISKQAELRRREAALERSE